MTIKVGTTHKEDAILTLLVKNKGGLTPRKISEKTGIQYVRVIKVLSSLQKFKIVYSTPANDGYRQHYYRIRKDSNVPDRIRRCSKCNVETVYWKIHEMNYWCRPCLTLEGINFYDD